MDYGKVEGSVLKYQGKYFKIRYVTVGCLVVDSDKLFGKFGDEFPLTLIKG